MREKTSQILRLYFKSHGKEEDEETQKRAIIKTAARLIRSDIKINVPSTFDEYLSIVIVAIALSTIAITHLYIISIQIAIMSIAKPCLHITMK